MKTIKLLLFVIALTIANTTFAQNDLLDINGLLLGKKYSKTQITNALGAPTKSSSWDDEFGGGEEYKYGNDIFRFETARGFVDFFIVTNKFELFDGQIRIGDNVTDLTLLKLPDSKLESAGSNKYYFYPVGREGDALFITTTNNGTMTKISYSVSE